VSHVKSYVVACVFSTAEVVTWMAPAEHRWRWRVALLALGLVLAF
jgi:hypothetical protein